MDKQEFLITLEETWAGDLSRLRDVYGLEKPVIGSLKDFRKKLYAQFEHELKMALKIRENE